MGPFLVAIGQRNKLQRSLMKKGTPLMQRTAKSALIRLIGSAATWALATGVMILLPIPTAQAASQVVCPAAITSCGCVITKSGTYTVANDLDASQTTQPVCIEISADHSILNLLV